MPEAEDGAGHGNDGCAGKVQAGQRGTQAGVLHADLDGKGLSVIERQPEQTRRQQPAQVAQTVVQHHHAEDQQARIDDAVLAARHHGTDDQHDGNDRDERHALGHVVDAMAQDGLDDETHNDGQQHHLHHRQEHARGIHLQPLRGEQPEHQRGEQRRQQRGHRGAGHRQRRVATGQIGHDVGRGAARAGPHQDDAHGQIRRQVKDLAQPPGQGGHDEELGAHAHQHGFRIAQHAGEILYRQREAHAQHDGSQQVGNPAAQIQEKAWKHEAQGAEQQHPQGEGLVGEADDSQQGVHADDAPGANDSVKAEGGRHSSAAPVAAIAATAPAAGTAPAWCRG